MKRVFVSLTSILLIATAAIGIISCSDDDNDIYRNLYPNALVTVKPVDANSFYMQLDDNITLKPTNMTSSPYGNREVRALINFDYVNQDASPYNRAVWVNWIDSILTKPAVPITDLQPSVEYGDDAVEIVRDWVTIAEDGYLTLRFRTLWGLRGRPHSVNLATGVNPNDAYEVEFFHDANGDTPTHYGDAIVAFRLDGLPDTDGKTVKLKLKWKSFSGYRWAEFDYCTGDATIAPNNDMLKMRPAIEIE